MIEHQWERLDEGYATCINCGQSTAWGYGDCVSEQEQKTPPQPKASERDTLRREIDRAARQLEGLSKSLKRLHERLKEAT